MSSAHHEPSITLSAFRCPSCGAHAHQDWYELLANALGKDKKPFFPDNEWFDFIEKDNDLDAAMRARFKTHAEKIRSADVFVERRNGSKDAYFDVNNLHLSKCFSCNDFALWLGNRLLYPSRECQAEPNTDMPVDVRADYIEAMGIAATSPRAAAALLRLAIQKLLPHLQVNAKDINGGIKELVDRGLDVRIQRALDIVRVVGNNAVHPGQMDISDDRETVNQLFHLINLICDYGISQPRMVDALYARLPQGSRDQIEKRDKSV